MLIGAHVSIAEDITLAPERALNLGCEVFQIFTRSPQGRFAIEITEEIGKKFKANCQKFKQTEFVVHSPYYINFGSTNNRIYHGSISAIKQELERANLLGAKYVITHLGSSKDLGKEKTIAQTIAGLQKTLQDYNGETELLIENSAGSGSIIGDNFTDIAHIIKAVNYKKLSGVCFDTCHAFTSGYNLSDVKNIENTFTKIDNEIGLDKIKWLHFNDSKFGFNSHKDRHEHIVRGRLGEETFNYIINFSKLLKINGNVETESEFVKEDIDKLKNFRNNK